ncbi:MAG: DUF2147 domain-containing protein [Pseudomonadota bacterium]
MRGAIIYGLIIMLSFCQLALASDSDEVVGTWVTQGGESQVDLYKCQNKYCGKIVWLKNPTYPSDDARGMAGQTKVDRENSEPSLRTRPILGLVILEALEFEGNDSWVDGRIYDPKNGKTYSCKMTLENKRLNVRGFIGISLLGRTAVWSRKP